MSADKQGLTVQKAARGHRLLKPEQLGERWQMPPDQIRRLARRGDIPALKIGHYWRFSEEAIEAYERGGAMK